jgi:hypothetical protein
VIEVAREHRSPPLELAEDVSPEARVGLEELVAALFPGVLVAAPAPPHPRLHERQVLDRPDEGVPLEELPFLPEETVELRRIEGAEPAEEHELLRRRDRRDRVHLQEAELSHGVEDRRGAPVEQLRPHGDAPGLLLSHLPHRRTCSSPM